MSDSLRPQGPQPQRFLCLWDFPGEDTEVGYHFLLQGIFLTQESNPHLLLGRQILYHSATCTCHEMVQKNLNKIFGQPIICPFYLKKSINAVILFLLSYLFLLLLAWLCIEANKIHFLTLEIFSHCHIVSSRSSVCKNWVSHKCFAQVAETHSTRKGSLRCSFPPWDKACLGCGPLLLASEAT